MKERYLTSKGVSHLSKPPLADAPDSPYPPEIKALFQQQILDYLDFTVGVDRIVEDGEELPFCGGITVIHTPGHTPGHICLYIGQNKTLIAGDALFKSRVASSVRSQDLQVLIGR